MNGPHKWRRSTFMAPIRTVTISKTWPKGQLSTTPLPLAFEQHKR